jgi:steroid delta-isomerase-like uncharacterized protein
MTPKEMAIEFTLSVWNDKKISLIFQYMDKDVAVHSLLGDFQGYRSMENIITQWMEGFPDLICHPLHVICEGERVVIHWKINATHKGPFRNIAPTNKKVAFSGIFLYHIQNGKITEYFAYTNMNQLYQQLSS